MCLIGDSGYSYIPENINQDQIYLVSEYLPQIGGVFLSPMLDKENSQILQMNTQGFMELTNTESMDHTMTKIQNHKIIIGLLRYRSPSNLNLFNLKFFFQFFFKLEKISISIF